MGIDLVIVLGIVFLTVLGVLLTGPGMWSEKWGWSALRRKRRAPQPPSSAGEDPAGRGTSPNDPPGRGTSSNARR